MSRSDRKRVTENCQASSSRNSLQATQKKDLPRPYPYTPEENPPSDGDQEESDAHAKHTVETTDFRDDWDNVHHPNLNCLWIGARSRQPKKRMFGPVVDHVKRVVAAQVIAAKPTLFSSPKMDAITLSGMMKNEWDKFLDAGERDGTIDRDKFDNFPTTEEAKVVSSKLLYL